MGGKNRIVKELLPIILKDRQPNQWYLEPFVGGCNMIDKVEGNRIGNDANKYVIALFRELQLNEKLFEELPHVGELNIRRFRKIKTNILIGLLDMLDLI